LLYAHPISLARLRDCAVGEINEINAGKNKHRKPHGTKKIQPAHVDRFNPFAATCIF
jgi:hypothetical protein